MISKLCTYNRRSEFILLMLLVKELEILSGTTNYDSMDKIKIYLGYLHKAID